MSRIDACRSCGHKSLNDVIDLGLQPLANALVAEHVVAECYPLKLVACARCTLIQITESVPPEKLFSDYTYFSSTSSTMVEHARLLVEQMILEWRIPANGLVVEIASNDGYLLQHYKSKGIDVLGIEPAQTVANAANDRGITTDVAFFTEAYARSFVAFTRHGWPKLVNIVHAHNVLAHVPDPNGFVRGVRSILSLNGVAVFEVPDVHVMVRDGLFDTIYHEHLMYFSHESIRYLFECNGMEIDRIERVQIHGGSIRVYARPSEHKRAAVYAWPSQSFRLGAFASVVRQHREDIRALLLSLREQGATIAGYGAAAKATVLLNHFDIGTDIIDFVVDKAPSKQGKFIPGVGIPVVPPDRLLEAMPDYCVIFPWNIADEIIAQQAEYQRRGGKFILVTKDPKIII